MSTEKFEFDIPFAVPTGEDYFTFLRVCKLFDEKIVEDANGKQYTITFYPDIQWYSRNGSSPIDVELLHNLHFKSKKGVAESHVSVFCYSDYRSSVAAVSEDILDKCIPKTYTLTQDDHHIISGKIIVRLYRPVYRAEYLSKKMESIQHRYIKISFTD